MRKLMWFAIGFGASCALGAYVYGSWIIAAMVCLVILAVAALVLTKFCKKLRIAAAITLGLAVGMAWFSLYDAFYLQPVRQLDAQSNNLEIVVSDYSFPSSYGSAVDGTVELSGKTYQLRAYLREFSQLSPGETISGEFSLRITTVGGVKDVTFHQGKGIFLLAYQRSSEIEVTDGTPGLLHQPSIWRSKLIEIINSSLPADAAAFARALLLGDKTGIDYETSTAFKVSGISHIIAVSGLHISILFGVLYLLTLRNRYLTALIGVPVVFLFAAVAGFTPSVVRAAIMHSLMMIALMFDKEYDGLTGLSFAGIVLLAVNPLVITSVSFQLSFGCMAGILLFSVRIRSYLMAEHRLGRWNNFLNRWISSSASVTLSAMVFTTPLAAVYFGTVSLIGILMNLLTLWVVTIVFYALMAVCIAGLFSAGVASFIGGVVAWPIRYILLMAKTLSQVPLSAVYTKSVYIVIWLVFCYVLLAIHLILRKKRAVLFTSLAAIGLCLAVTISWLEPMMSTCNVTVLDVGQGQSVIVQYGTKTFLVDCGGDYDEDAADITAETLLSRGISRLDGIIVTHYDADHAGGIDELLTRIDTDLLLMPDVTDENKVGKLLEDMAKDAALYVSDDMQITFDGGKITVFAPLSYESSNESSISVLFEGENCAIMVMGDKPASGEKVLLSRYDLPKLDVLVVGHHGSKSSTCEEFLGVTQPEYAIISVGEDNRYGHPNDDVLRRLEAANCKVYRTDLHGTIQFRR